MHKKSPNFNRGGLAAYSFCLWFFTYNQNGQILMGRRNLKYEAESLTKSRTID